MTDNTPDPADIRAQAERTELMRIACQSIVDHHEYGRRIADEATLIWARDFVRFNPRYPLPLTTGEPE